MRANQIQATPKPAQPLWILKDKTCRYCLKEIQQTFGVHVGGNTYCDYDCYSNQSLDSPRRLK